MANDFDQSRPDRDAGDRRDADGPARTRRAGRRRARLQSLFRPDDLRPWSDACHLADHGDGTRPQAPFGARPAPHRPPGPVAGGPGVHPDLAVPLAGRRSVLLWMGQDRELAQAGGRLCALAAMGGLALLCLYRAAVVHLGAGAAGLGAGSRIRCGGAECRACLVLHVRPLRLSGDGHCRRRPGDDAWRASSCSSALP